MQAESLREKIRLLEDNLALAQKDLDRLNKLRAPADPSGLADEIVSEQDLERQQLVVHRAKTEMALPRPTCGACRRRGSSLKAAEADYGAAVAAKTEAVAAIPIKSLRKRLEMAKAERP